MNEENIDNVNNHVSVENKSESDQGEKQWEDILGSGSILKRILQEGTSDTRPQRLQICEINYVAKLENSIEVDRKDNFIMQLGDCDVVQGLDLSIGLMNIGEICELKIEARLAYGSRGLPPLIPSEATVIYKIELVSVKDEDDPETLTVTQRKLNGNKKREKGNWWYGRGENTLAIQCYRRALDYLDELEGGVKEDLSEKPDVSDGELQNLLEDRLSVCNNMAAAQIKLGLYEPALNSLETVLRCQPDNVKALYRKAKIYRAKNEYTTSYKLLQKAIEVSPEDADIQKELNSLSKLIKKQKVSEKELAKRMFNVKDNNKNHKEVDKKVQAWTVVAASMVVGILGLAMYKYKYI